MFDEIPHSHKDAVDWTALLGCYTHLKMPVEALDLYRGMRGAAVEPDDATMVCVFNAFAQLGDARVGDHCVGVMVKMGLVFTLRVRNSMLGMYTKCGLMGEAKRVFYEMEERSVITWTVVLEGLVRCEGVESGRVLFDAMPERNEVAWTIMIRGFVENGFTKEAFSLLREMVFGFGIRLNYVTLCSLLSGCAVSGDAMIGKWVHCYALKVIDEDEMDPMVGTALVDMYAKCGRMNVALRVFWNMKHRNVVTWNALLCGLAIHGLGHVALELFPCMVKEVKPDAITMTCLMNACSHSGLVDQGLYYFKNLETLYGIKPQVEHYACIVDLLGRSGKLEAAEEFVKKMPIRPNSVILGSLLGSCRCYGKLHLAENLFQHLVEVAPENTECHVLLYNMYALSGKREKANHIRIVLREKGIRKVPGMSSIHVEGQVHHFSAGDKSHPRALEIYSKLDEVFQKLRSAGYVPETAAQVFASCDGEEKEQALFSHSEKLAVCFGLISTKPGMPLYIFKNLRICRDCHSAMKIVSSVYDREIVIRDRSRFHCFKHGSCSCSDYW